MYGTLRTGQPYHHLLGGSPLAFTATPPDYELLNLGRYPGLVTDGHTKVVGEVYEVDEQTLGVLDEYEDHPNEYIRREITLDDGTRAQAYIFQPKGVRYPIIASGNWLKR